MVGHDLCDLRLETLVWASPDDLRSGESRGPFVRGIDALVKEPLLAEAAHDVEAVVRPFPVSPVVPIRLPARAAFRRRAAARTNRDVHSSSVHSVFPIWAYYVGRLQILPASNLGALPSRLRSRAASEDEARLLSVSSACLNFCLGSKLPVGTTPETGRSYIRRR